MIAAPTRRQAETATWLLVWAGLATGIGIESDWGQRWHWPIAETTPAPADFAAPVLAEPFRLAHPDQFLAITERPLFIVTRRPAPAAPPPEPPKPSMKRDQFVLLGTTIVPEGKFAFLLERAGNKHRVVAEGKEINGIMVKEVSPERVILSQHGDAEVLTLKTNAAAAAARPGGTPTPRRNAPPVPPGQSRPAEPAL